MLYTAGGTGLTPGLGTMILHCTGLWQKNKQTKKAGYRAVGKYTNCSGGDKEDGKERKGEAGRTGEGVMESGSPDQQVPQDLPCNRWDFPCVWRYLPCFVQAEKLWLLGSVATRHVGS